MKNKVLVSGCKGKMGEIICSLIANTSDMEVVCGFDITEDLSGSFPVYNDIKSLTDIEKPDVIIDFSKPAGTDAILKYAWLSKTPIVIATTGLFEATLENIEKIANEIPVFQAANMSIQVNLLKHVLETIAKTIPSAEVEITETHHNRKIDSPSGTAKVLASAVKEALEETKGVPHKIIYGREGKRKENEIGVCAKRGANVVGTHTIEFFSPFETLEITHTAHSRELFADGAITAAKYLLNKDAGLYGMDDLMENLV